MFSPHICEFVRTQQGCRILAGAYRFAVYRTGLGAVRLVLGEACMSPDLMASQGKTIRMTSVCDELGVSCSRGALSPCAVSPKQREVHSGQ